MWKTLAFRKFKEPERHERLAMQTSLEANPPLLGTVALSALNLTKTYGRGAGSVRALNGISVDIAAAS